MNDIVEFLAFLSEKLKQLIKYKGAKKTQKTSLSKCLKTNLYFLDLIKYLVGRVIKQYL